MLVTAVGVPDTVHEGNRLLKVPGSNASVERILARGTDFFYWQPSASEGPAPSDWAPLASAAGAHQIASALPLACVRVLELAGEGLIMMDTARRVDLPRGGAHQGVR